MSRDRPQEIRKTLLLANFRVPKWKQETKKPRIQTRPGNDPQHLANIRKLTCATCGEKRYVQAHHLRSGPAMRERGIGMKALDKRVIPLCIACHDDVHKLGSRREIEHFEAVGIDCHALADGLWSRRGDVESMARVLLAHQLQASGKKLSEVRQRGRIA